LIPALYYIFQSAREKGTAWRIRRGEKHYAGSADTDDKNI
jgi:hypothetical protein